MVNSPLSSLFLFPLLCAARSGTLGRLPPLGWNTWCSGGSKCGQHGAPMHLDKYHDVCHEDEVKAVASEMQRNGMQAAGYNYVNLDDCWIDPNRSATGQLLQSDPNRFPSGMKALADWLHDRGFLFGVYTSGGRSTCANGGRDPGDSHRAGKKIPGSYPDFYSRDADTLATWGVDFLKMDWCDASGLDPEHITLTMAKALNATGRQIWFNFHCYHPGDWGHADTGPIPSWCPAAGNSYRISKDHNDAWSGIYGTAAAIEILKLGAQWNATGPNTATTAWNDPDFIMTGGAGCDRPGLDRCPGQTEVEYRTEFSLWCMAAAQLVLATDPRGMPPSMLAILLNKDLLQLHQDVLGIAGGLVEESEGQSQLQVWARPLSDGTIALALYNAGNATARICSHFEKLPVPRRLQDGAVIAGARWGPATHVNVYNLWTRQETSDAVGEFQADVIAHGVEVFKLSPVQAGSVVV